MAKTTIKRKDVKEDEYEDYVVDKEGTEDADNDLLPYADNSGNVPLFANSDGRSNRTIASLKLYKLEEKGYAYKGAIPLNSTKESIGEQFGDGVYNIEACNKKHKVLDIAENIRISLGHRLPADNTQKEVVHSGASAADLDRIERLATKSADESKEMTKQLVQLVIETAKEQIIKEREYMAATQKNMSDFMSGMSAMQAQSFQQTMTLLQTSHNYTLQQLTAGNKDNSKEPMQLVETLIKGINLGKDMSDGGEDDEMPFWQQILEGGIDIMSKAAKAKEMLAGSNSPNQLAAPTMSAKELHKRKKALMEALTLRKAVRSSGLTTEEALRKLQTDAESPPPDEESDDEDSDDESDDEDSFEEIESQESEGAGGTN